MNTRQRVCAGLLLGFLGAALLLPHLDDTTPTFYLPLIGPPLLAVLAARLRIALPPRLVGALAITLGAATLALCWAEVERLARQATTRAERDYMLGEGAFLAAVAAATPPALSAPDSAPPTNEDPYQPPWAHDIERIEHLGPWPTPNGPPLPLAFRWRATPTPTDAPPCGPGAQRLARGATTLHALVELPRTPLHVRVPPLGTHIWLVALGFAGALLLTRRSAVARMLVGAALLVGLAWARSPVRLDPDFPARLTLAAQDLVSARPVDPAALAACPAPPGVRFVEGPAGIEADLSSHDTRNRSILLIFFGMSLALGAVLGLLIRGLEAGRA